MKNMNATKAGLIVLVVCTVLLFFLRNITLTPPMTKPVQEKNSIKVQNARVTNTSAAIKYKIDVSYPQFSGLTNQAAETAMNAAIKKQINADIANFRKEVTSTEQELQNLPSHFQEVINEFYITYKLPHVNNDAVSVSFTVMDYQAGMNHPNNYNEVFNYDLNKNKEIMLSDIFKPGSDYLTALSKLSREQLQVKFKNNPYAPEFIIEGTKPDTKNFSLFALGKDSLYIIFNPYQVAPYYEGTQIVKIPYAALKDIINREYTN
jgi:hypothetical protein